MKFLISILILSLFASDLPFWKKKPEVYRQIKEEKQIIVSAKVKENENEKRLDIISAGHIQSPLAFSWKTLLNFKNYDKITDHFKDIEYSPTKQELYFKVGALGYYADLWLKLKPQESETKKTLEWHCYKGNFRGMKGVIAMERFNHKTTEISMQADFSGKSIPIPDVLISFGMEVVGKQIASKMRSYVEDSYKNDTSFD